MTRIFLSIRQPFKSKVRRLVKTNKKVISKCTTSRERMMDKIKISGWRSTSVYIGYYLAKWWQRSGQRTPSTTSLPKNDKPVTSSRLFSTVTPSAFSPLDAGHTCARPLLTKRKCLLKWWPVRLSRARGNCLYATFPSFNYSGEWYSACHITASRSFSWLFTSHRTINNGNNRLAAEITIFIVHHKETTFLTISR